MKIRPASLSKDDAGEKRQSSRLHTDLPAQISGENGSGEGLILNLSRDGLAFTMDRHAARRIFSGQELPGELVTVRYDTMDSHSRLRRIEAAGIVVWSEVVADELQMGIRWG